MQCDAACCSLLQCFAVRCSVLQCAAMFGSVLQCVAVCCSVLQCVAVCVALCCSMHLICDCSFECKCSGDMCINLFRHAANMNESCRTYE